MNKIALSVLFLMLASVQTYAQSERPQPAKVSKDDGKPDQRYWLSASLNAMASWAKAGSSTRR